MPLQKSSRATAHMSFVSSQNIRMKSIKVLWVAVAVLLNLAGSFCQLDVCGQTSFNTKIVGGESATEGSWPWQAYIHCRRTQKFCGGSLINEDWVLSAAHCFRRNDTSDILIYLGRRSQAGPNPDEVNRTVIRLITHHNHNITNSDNDIALLKLSSPVNFTNYIKPVCLAAAGCAFQQNLWVTGWGDLYGNKTYPDTLQEVKVPFVSPYNCNIAYPNQITENMLCAGELNAGGIDSCQGDSGGPLVTQLKQNSSWIQCGIVSFGNSCADPQFPGVYTNVSQYQKWIKNYTVSDPPGFVTCNIDHYYDGFIFSGSSLSLYLFSLALTFSIISLT